MNMWNNGIIKGMGIAAFAISIANTTFATPPTITNQAFVHMSISGTPGTTYSVQRTTQIGDTNSWVTVSSFLMTNSPTEWVDTTPISSDPGFFRVPTSHEEYLITAPASDIGAVATNQVVATSFTTSTNVFSISTIHIPLHSPQAGTVVLHLYSDSNGKPGSEFVTLSTNITAGTSEAVFTFGNLGLGVASNTRYWLGLTASGVGSINTFYGQAGGSSPLTASEGFSVQAGILTRKTSAWTTFDATNTLVFSVTGFPASHASATLSFLSHLTVTGDVGTECIVTYANQGDTNWQTLTNLTIASSPITFVDSTAADTSKRGYAITVAPTKPTQVILEPANPMIGHGINSDAIWASSFTSGTNLWQISSMHVGLYYGGFYTINFHLYEDDNGLPGTEIYTVENTYDSTFVFAAHDVDLQPNAKYWVGIEHVDGNPMPGVGYAAALNALYNSLTGVDGFTVTPGLVYRDTGAWTVEPSQTSYTLEFTLFVLPQ